MQLELVIFTGCYYCYYQYRYYYQYQYFQDTLNLCLTGKFYPSYSTLGWAPKM